MLYIWPCFLSINDYQVSRKTYWKSNCNKCHLDATDAKIAIISYGNALHSIISFFITLLNKGINKEINVLLADQCEILISYFDKRKSSMWAENMLKTA